MLVLVHGAHPNVGSIAKKIFFELNNLRNYSIENYTVDFEIEPGTNTNTSPIFKVYDSNKKLVYGNGVLDLLHDQSSTEEYKPPSEDGNRIFNKILDTSSVIHQNIEIAGFLRGYRLSWWMTDFNILPPDHPVDGWSETKYQSIIYRYEERKFDCLVLSGLFSKFALDRLKQDLGDNNVKIVNIVRNPSIEYLIKLDVWTDHPDSLDLRFFNLYYNSIKHKEFNNSSTYNFENILKDGYINFENYNIDLSKTFTPYNQYITQDEFNNLISNKSPQEVENILAEANVFFSNMKEQYDNHESNQEKPLDTSNLPSNMFTELGYQPLSYQDIISKSQ